MPIEPERFRVNTKQESLPCPAVDLMVFAEWEKAHLSALHHLPQ